MYHPQTLIIFLISYSCLVYAAPLVYPKGGFCGLPPKLEIEMLDVDHNWNLISPPWMFELFGDADSGGTSGHQAQDRNHNFQYLLGLQNANSTKSMMEPYPMSNAPFVQQRVVNTTTYPLNTVGRLFFERFKGDKGGWCSGTLVGRRLLLTASHCFPWEYNKRKWMRFVPGYGDNTFVEPYGGSYVSRCRGAKNELNVTGIDYIVCALCEPLGDRVGWMGTIWWNDTHEYLQRPWFSSGYPIDTVHGRAHMLISNLTLANVDPHGETGIELESQVFASAGRSGGPLWGYVNGQPKIAGVCSGGERNCSERPGGCSMGDSVEPFHDVSAGGRLMTELVHYARAYWDN